MSKCVPILIILEIYTVKNLKNISCILSIYIKVWLFCRIAWKLNSGNWWILRVSAVARVMYFQGPNALAWVDKFTICYTILECYEYLSQVELLEKIQFLNPSTILQSEKKFDKDGVSVQNNTIKRITILLFQRTLKP